MNDSPLLCKSIGDDIFQYDGEGFQINLLNSPPKQNSSRRSSLKFAKSDTLSSTGISEDDQTNLNEDSDIEEESKYSI